MVERRELTLKTLDEVADIIANASNGSSLDQTAKAEFARRQTSAQIDAARSTKIAAWSGAIAAVAAMIAAIAALLSKS